MNFITEYISQKIACESTGISEYKMLQSRKLNKPVDVFSLDIGLNLDGTLIDVEIDGKYWHQD